MASPRTPTNKRTRSSQSASTEPSRKKLCTNARTACPPPVGELESPIKATAPVSILEKTLRRLATSVDLATVRTLKNVASVDELPLLVQTIIEHAQELVAERCHKFKGKRKLLQGELYVEWLYECEYILTAIENILHAKLQTTVGRTLFSILFHLVDEYVSAVDRYQDGWSYEARYDWVMSLVEEANAASASSTIDARSADAVRDAETQLDWLDKILQRVVLRFKAESIDHKRLAGVVGMKEEALARACCLLSEQTGFGDADEMGFGLLVNSREAMLQWKSLAKAKSARQAHT
uniref:Uncharacterized protein n=1 Tax=Mycena chlorophos TaxID=658473 RepID=A0ABQ0LHC9_MYCCL|nr:predicted protein [Mycena chlorophos]